MDLHAAEYYSPYTESGPHGHFHKVIALHDDHLLNWSEIHKIVPRMCRGWYELAQLSIQDRIEFTRDFWLAKFSYHPVLTEFLMNFFASLDDIGIFLTQRSYEDPFIPHLVYSLADNNGFFHGESPANEEDIIHLQKEFTNYILPVDYLSFLQIHNGFAKQSDTGLISSAKMKETYDVFQKILEGKDELMTSPGGTAVNPTSLIPFYESYGMPFFQCFWGEWYPAHGMGNVYYSSQMNKISTCERKEECGETLAFPSFMSWLMFYLEKLT